MTLTEVLGSAIVLAVMSILISTTIGSSVFAMKDTEELREIHAFYDKLDTEIKMFGTEEDAEIDPTLDGVFPEDVSDFEKTLVNEIKGNITEYNDSAKRDLKGSLVTSEGVYTFTPDGVQYSTEPSDLAPTAEVLCKDVEPMEVVEGEEVEEETPAVLCSDILNSAQTEGLYAESDIYTLTVKGGKYNENFIIHSSGLNYKEETAID